MSRIAIFASVAAILLVLAAGCSDQPPAATPAATDVQASPTPPKAGKAVKEDVRAPAPPNTMGPG